jgi:hypothetical protein
MACRGGAVFRPPIILSEKWKATVLLTKIAHLTTGLPGRRRHFSAMNRKAGIAYIPPVHADGIIRKSTKAKAPLQCTSVSGPDLSISLIIAV